MGRRERRREGGREHDPKKFSLRSGNTITVSESWDKEDGAVATAGDRGREVTVVTGKGRGRTEAAIMS